MTERLAKNCPDCGEPLKRFLFMGVDPDGWICDKCHIYFTDKMKPLATVIGGD